MCDKVHVFTENVRSTLIHSLKNEIVAKMALDNPGCQSVDATEMMAQVRCSFFVYMKLRDGLVALIR